MNGSYCAMAVRRAGRVSLRSRVLAVLGLTWLVGAVLFLRADGSVTWKLERREQPPQTEHNLALSRWGPMLRASSYYRDAWSHHHPIFLVDARAEPHEVEKWASGVRDRAPWVEISWREPRRLTRVVVYHAGWRERSSLTIRRYRLQCLTEAGVRGTIVDVSENTRAIATHALPCERARGLRVEWTPNTTGDPVRVYEIEAWGR